MRLAGVDGCPGGWVAAVAEWSGRSWEWLGWEVDVAGAALPGLASAVVIDIPMGLPEHGRRPLEAVVRKRLAPRGSTVFPTPVRSVLEATSYDQACALSRRDCDGKAISLQTWHLLPKITEMDAVDGPLVEGHPELVFATLARRVLQSKKRLPGRLERIALLTDELRLPVSDLVDTGRRLGSARPDDLLDAMALLWTARRWALGEAKVFDDGPDGRGRPMRIAL